MTEGTLKGRTGLMLPLASNSSRVILPAIAAVAVGVASGALSGESVHAGLVFGGLCLAAVLLWALRAHFLVVLMVIVWYLPPQTGPGGLLEFAPYLRWAGVLLVPLIAVVLLVRALSGNRALTVTPLAFPMAAVLCAILLSALANGSSTLEAISIALLYLRYPLLFIALVNLPLSLGTTREVVKVFFVLVAIQIPEVVIRFVATGGAGDTISWSLGPYGTFSLGVYCIYAMCLVAGIMVTRGVTVARLAVLCVLLVPSVMGEIKALVLLGPVCVFAVLLLPSARLVTLSRRLAAVAVILVAVAGVYTAWAVVYPGSDNLLSRAVTQLDRLLTGSPSVEGARGVDRLSWTIESASALAKSDGLTFGAGPGSGLAGGIAGKASRGQTQLTSALWDFGILGMASYAWLLLAALSVVVAAVRSVRDMTALGYACAMVGIWLFYAILGPNYDQVWRYDAPSFLFWVLLAGIYVASRSSSSPSLAEI